MMTSVAAIATAITAIQTLIEAAPVLIQSVSDLKAYAVALYEKFTGGKITPEARKELEDRIDGMHNEFQKPIPPENER